MQSHLNSCLSITRFSEHLLPQILRGIMAYYVITMVGLEVYVWFEEGQEGVEIFFLLSLLLGGVLI